jgi:phosphoglycolate phosphatase-like HAD superfamily hydrolase
VGYRLLVVDLDGTLLDRSGAVREEDRAAIVEVQRRGTIVSLLTGRLYSGTRAIARSFALDGPVACVDGSHIVDAATDRDLFVQSFASGPADWLRSELATCPVTSCVFAGDRVLHAAAGAAYLSYLRFWSPIVQQVDDVLSLTHWQEVAAPMAVVALGAAEPIQSLVRRIETAAPGGLQAAAFDLGQAGLRDLWGMIARAAGADKGTALRWVADHHGVRPDEVVAVGDWFNDVPMLRAAGRSFAMGQASREVKAAATDVLQATARTGGGIAEAARRSGLL